MSAQKAWKLTNTQARHAVLSCAGLSSRPAGACNSETLLGLIKSLAYVQQDPLNIVARAHDHILWTRNSAYRPQMLDRLMSKERTVFEHFTHDACVLPMDTMPYWTHQFKRQKKKMSSAGWVKNRFGKKEQGALLKRIQQEGPLCSKDFKSKEKRPLKVWGKPAHKQTLDYLWLTGELAVAKRVKFSKYYDLPERIYPDELTSKAVSEQAQIDWLNVNALERLGFGTPGEIMRFWEATTLAETKLWQQRHTDTLNEVLVESAAGDSKEFVIDRQQFAAIKKSEKPTTRLRIINPFDPIVRDRKRLAWLFGFEYRIEIYTPPAKRQYGYYVYPLLEFDSFVGRIEIRHDKESNKLRVENLWPEPGVKFGKARMNKLKSELARLARFCGAEGVDWNISTNHGF